MAVQCHRGVRPSRAVCSNMSARSTKFPIPVEYRKLNVDSDMRYISAFPAIVMACVFNLEVGGLSVLLVI